MGQTTKIDDQIKPPRIGAFEVQLYKKQEDGSLPI